MRLHRIIALRWWIAGVLVLSSRGTTAQGEPLDSSWHGRPAFTATVEELRGAVASVPDDKSAEVAVLWSDVSYRIDAQGRAAVRRRTVYRVPRAGDLEDFEEWDVAQIGWAPWYQDRPSLRARVLNPDGSFRELDAATITERPAERWGEDLFSDSRVLEAPLPGLVDDSIVEMESVVTDREPFFEAGSLYREMPLVASFVLDGRLTVEVDPTLRLGTKVEGAASIRTSVLSHPDRWIRHRFEYGPLMEPEAWQSSVPAEGRPEPSISFSTAPDWRSVAREYATVVDSKLVGANLGAFVGSPPRGLSREAAIDWVLARTYPAVRYTGLELGAQAIVPVPPSETIRRGFGDCKDQATLVVAALRRLGVPAHVALLRPGRDRDVSPDLPGMGLFTHAIVHVPGQPAYWVDPTFKFARYGDLPDGDLGRWALIAAEGTTELVRTPAVAPSGRRQIEVREVFLAPFGKGRVVETSQYFGVSEVEARASYESRSQKALREQFEEYAKNNYLSAKLDRFEVSTASDLGRPFRIRLEMSGSGRAIADAGEGAVGVMVSDLLQHLPWPLSSAIDRDPNQEVEPEDRRTLPYRIDGPTDAALHYVIHLPAGMVVRDPPGSTEHRLGPITLSRTIEHPAANRVEVDVRLKIEPTTLSVAEFEDLERRMPELGKEPALLVYFDQEVARHLAAGKVGDAIDLASDLVDGEPGSSFRRDQMALALLAAGLGEAAQREAEKAAALEPESSLAHQTLGWCRQHDSIGRRFGPGFPRDAAISAYRRATELDSKNFVAQADLAILLEHDDRGRRYPVGLDLSEPIAIYQALDKLKALGGLKNNLPIALLHSGRSKEALELLPREGLAAGARSLRLDALVLERGVDAAITEAQRWLTSPNDRQLALRSAGFDMLNQRRFADAAALLKAAGADAPNPAEVLSFAGAVERAALWQVASDSPEAAFAELMHAMIEDDFLTQLRSRTAPEVLEVLGDSHEALVGSTPRLNALIRTASTGTILQPAVMMDLGIRAAQVERAGDAASGYRLKMTLMGAKEAIRAYFVSAPDGWRAVLAGRPTGALGAYAWKALERGDLPTARRWLDWAYEEDEAALGDNVVRRLWSPTGDQTEAKSRLTALALIVEAGGSAEFSSHLERAADGANVSERFAMDLALARGARFRDDYLGVLGAVAALAKQGGGSPEIRLLRVDALERLGRWDELQQYGVSLRGRSDTKGDADRIEARAELGSGRLAEAVKRIEAMVAAGTATAAEFNSAAWAALFLPGLLDRAGHWGERAVELTAYKEAGALNTLAAVYAWQAKPREAYQLLMQSLAKESDPVPDAADWLVLARVCEDYGLRSEAIELYRRAVTLNDATEAPESLSVSRLAQVQLNRLASPQEVKRR